jgi:hypothetical protein
MSSCHCESRHFNVELEPGKGPARSIYRRGKAVNITKFEGREIEEIKR